MLKKMIIIILFVCFLTALSLPAESFKDDFEDGELDGWTSSGIWTPLAGEVWGVGLLLLNEVRGADLKLQCDVRLNSCRNWAGIVVRYLEGNGCAGVIGLAPDGAFPGCGMLLGIIELREWFRPRIGTLKGVVPSEWYTLKLSAHRGTVTLSVDEIGKKTLRLEYEHRIGSVGLYSSHGVRFDNFVVMDWAAVSPESKMTTTWALIKKVF